MDALVGSSAYPGVRKSWKFRQDAYRKAPSSGMMGVALALVSCCHVDVYGFTVRRRLPQNGFPCAKYVATGARCPMTMKDYFGKEGGFHAWELQFDALTVLSARGELQLLT